MSGILEPDGLPVEAMPADVAAPRAPRAHDPTAIRRGRVARIAPAGRLLHVVVHVDLGRAATQADAEHLRAILGPSVEVVSASSPVLAAELSDTVTRLERELFGARHALDESQRVRIAQSLELDKARRERSVALVESMAARSRVAELELRAKGLDGEADDVRTGIAEIMRSIAGGDHG